MRSSWLMILASIGAASCSPSNLEPARPSLSPAAVEARDGNEPISKNARDVADVTRSPWPAQDIDARSATLSAACGLVDGVLVRIATELARDRAKGHGAPDPDAVIGRLRERGEPHVRPRILSTSGRGVLDDEALRGELAAMKRPTTRCGVGVATTDQGKELLVGVAVDALADLDPLPIRARTGEWLTWSARLRAPAENAKLVILGPRGVPRTVPTSSDATGLVRARFALDRPGAFTVQLVADVAGGPQPLLEARVFADVAPDFEETSAPGEDAKASTDEDALLAMTTALRNTEALPKLERTPQLDALARAHASQMRAKGAIAHDTGDGDLRTRFEAEGLAASVIGENVARARSAALVHRALHASPSHRMNLLRADYTHIGIGVVRDDAGTLYACEVFASQLR